MGEARRKALVDAAQAQTNGKTGYLVKPRRVPIVHHLKLQNVETDRVTILMLCRNESSPELGMAFSPTEARRLAEALTHHADLLERAAPRIILAD